MMIAATNQGRRRLDAAFAVNRVREDAARRETRGAGWAMTFSERLAAAVRRKGNPVLVGIDPRLDQLPDSIRASVAHDRAGAAQALEAFGSVVLDVVAPLVPAVKFQAAFYEAHGPEGMTALFALVQKARGLGLVTILDGKRNDIGSTAEAYAGAYLGAVSQGGGEPEEVWAADALTVNPYLGSDGIAPFVTAAQERGRGIFVLVRTSNASAREFQDLVCDGRPVYRHVAERLLAWNAPTIDRTTGFGAVGAVVGATYPDELAELRGALPGVWLLVPGYGAQGGTAADVASAFDAETGLGAIVNNSRGIVFAFRSGFYRDRFGAEWPRAIEAATRDMIADLATHTPASRLAEVVA
jgi:orotidine-5'-phosphate decarboxylase